jgi:hypothetical protein
MEAAVSIMTFTHENYHLRFMSSDGDLLVATGTS